MADAALALSVVVLAAGASRRLGEAKQALRLHGEPLLLRSVRLAAALHRPPSTRVRTHVMLGAWQPPAGMLDQADVTVHINQDWRDGRRSALALAARAASGDDGLLVLLCDQYRLEPRHLGRLVDAFAEQPQRAVVSTAGGVRMPPVIWPQRAFAALARARTSGREHFGDYDPLEVELPEAAFDVDEPRDLTTLRRFESGGG